MSIQDISNTNPARRVTDMTVPTGQVILYMTFGYLDQCLGNDAQITFKIQEIQMSLELNRKMNA